MAEQGMFKTAMRGFRKEDVLSYIDTLMAERTAQETLLNEQIEQLRQQLAEAQVQKEAVAENERLTAQVAELNAQVEALSAQVAEVTAQLEAAQGVSAAGEARQSELAEQLEQAHQAISGLWEEKAQLQRQLEDSYQVARRVQELGEEFCRKVGEVLPQPESSQPQSEAAKPMERWLF